MSLNNETQSFNTTPSMSTIIVVLDLVEQRFINQLPLIITLLGLIGFIGNIFTFLQPTLRYNSFCIYTLCGSFIDVLNLFINLFPKYLSPTPRSIVSSISVSLICKLKLFALALFPQLSMNLLIISLIDRYACTYGPTSPMHRLLQLKMVPWLIGITVIISCLLTFHASILNDVIPGLGCISTQPIINATLYILIQGIMTPLVMFILMLLTYQRSKRSRRRVGAAVVANIHRFRNHFIAMAFAQIFVSSFFILQWIIVYCYFIVTQYNKKSTEGWAITYFVFALTNYLYYIINVRSFYLSTLTSRLFRNTLIEGLRKLLPGHLYQRWNAKSLNAGITAGARTRREGESTREI